MVRILLMGLPANSRFHFGHLGEQLDVHLVIQEGVHFSTPPAFTTPSRRMRSSNNSTETSLGFGGHFRVSHYLRRSRPSWNDCRKRP